MILPRPGVALGSAPMPWLAFALLTSFLLIVFPLRSMIRRRRHGDAGRADWAARRPRAWLLADLTFLSAFALLIVGSALQGLDIVAPVVDVPDTAFGLAIVVIAGATALAIWSQETMGAAWRPDMPPAATAQLVTGGPFRVVRNPNYIAMLAAGLSAVLLAANLVSAVGWAALLVSLMLTARVEEPLLAERYGAPYRSYAARVGRFVPGVGLLAWNRPATGGADLG